MSRHAATIEYLKRLVEWSGGDAEFCKAANVWQSNLSAYREGVKSLSWKWLHRKTAMVLGLPPAFIPICEGKPVIGKTLSVSDLEDCSGLYALFDSTMEVIYVGKAAKLRTEVNQTLKRPIAEMRPWDGKKEVRFLDVTCFLSAYRIERGDAHFRHDVEALILRLFINNTYNKNKGRFKRIE